MMWAYCVATAYTMIAFFTLVALCGGSADYGLGSRFTISFAGILVCGTIIPTLALPTYIASLVVSLLSFKSGARHILTGALVGALPLIASATTGGAAKGVSTSGLLAFILAGAIGGFVYWRLRGYPDAGPRLVRMAEKCYRLAPRVTKWLFKLRPV